MKQTHLRAVAIFAVAGFLRRRCARVMHLPRPSKFWIASLFTSGCVLLLSHPAWAQAIPIANSSFEDQVVADGSYSTNVPGWNFFGGGPFGNALDATVNPGGPSSGEPWPSSTPAGLDGSNFGQIFVYGAGGGGIVYQDTGIQYQAGKTYILTADFGLQTNQTFASFGQMELSDSSLTNYAETQILSSNLTSGAFTGQSVTYTATGLENPGAGEFGTEGDIFVAFTVYDSPAQSYLDFDSVHLTIVPEPGSIAIAALAGFGLLGLLRRQRKQIRPYLLALTFVAGASSAGLSQTSIPIANSSFEDPVVVNNPDILYGGSIGFTDALPGWTISSNGDIYDLQNSPVMANQDGSQHLEDFSYAGANGGGYVLQNLPNTFVNGSTYTLTAYAGPEINGSNTFESGDYFFIGSIDLRSLLAVTAITATTNDVLAKYTVQFTVNGEAVEGDGIEIGFFSPPNSAQSDMEIDNFSLTVTMVPEPGSVVIAALGGLVLLGLLRRRTKQIRLSLLALAAVAVASSTGFSQTFAPIVNATFNSPNVASGSYKGITGAAGTSPLPGWTVNAPFPLIVVDHPATPPSAAPGQDNSQFAEEVNDSAHGWNSAVTISQALTTSFVAGDYYELTADASTYSVSSTGIAEIGDTFFIANSSGDILASTVITGTSLGAFTQFTVTFTSTGLLGDTGPIVIGYQSPEAQTNGEDSMSFDNFALQVVPEPGSIAIVALGGLVLIGRRKMGWNRR